ncbi:MAG: acetylornithine transaminase [Corynebacterium sp.]|nr:acetylornithine transaminase [Corynebacterium sp.]
MTQAKNTGHAIEQWPNYLMNNYGTPAREFVRGEGCWLIDNEGKRYLDLLAGIAVNALGYAHPDVVKAISEQAATLGHISNLFTTGVVVDLAEELVARATAGKPETETKVLLCNSGAEANEAAFKLARLTGKPRILAALHGFHGRTMGALAMTGQPDKAAPFAPLPAGVEFYEYGNLEQLRGMMDNDVAAIILEPIQGETGVIPAPEGFLKGVQDLCREYDALFIADEVQTGVGRTGDFYAHQHDGVDPDIITMAKGLGGGLPIGACIARGKAASFFGPGKHGTTFGGNPIVAAAALTVLEHLDADFLESVKTKGAALAQKLAAIDGVTEVRGRGLMLGVVLEKPVAKQIVTAALEGPTGLILNAPAENVLRLTPPLIINDEEMDMAVELLAGLIAEQST